MLGFLVQQPTRPGRSPWCKASVMRARRALLGCAAQRTGKAGQVLGNLHEVHVLGQRPVARMHLPIPAGPVRCDVAKKGLRSVQDTYTTTQRTYRPPRTGAGPHLENLVAALGVGARNADLLVKSPCKARSTMSDACYTRSHEDHTMFSEDVNLPP